MKKGTSGAARRKAGRSAQQNGGLGEQFHRRLANYAAAAGAAGVGILAMAQPANAEIVYVPENQPITTGAYVAINPHGITVVNLHNEPGATTSGITDELWASGSVAAAAIARIAALKQGEPIGPGHRFSDFGLLAFRWKTNYNGRAGTTGSWVNVRQRYLGFEFGINGQAHYGWARLTVMNGPGVSIKSILTGYAYNTIAGQQILAGQTSADLATQPDPEALANQATPQLLAAEGPKPGTLGLLALGSLGIPYWRREEPSPES